MKKAIVVTAIGRDYQVLFGRLAPTFRSYAAAHGWDLKVISELPKPYLEQFARPDWPVRTLFSVLRLYQPTMFSEYDLLALMDPDMVVNPKAPCLSSYYDNIPRGGIAAVQDVSFRERKLFPDWGEYHYSDFVSAAELARLPFPELHVNTGLMLVKPSEVKEGLLELAGQDSDLIDEHRVNLHLTQQQRVAFLPEKWNVVYPYELARRGYKPTRQSTSRTLGRFQYQWNVRVVEQRRIRGIFPDSYVLHFASSDKNIAMHINVKKLLSSVGATAP